MIEEINKKATVVAMKAARDSGRFLLEEFGQTTTKDFSVKGQYEFVSHLDRDSEKMIIKAIEREFPDHSILSEEAGMIDKKSDYLWIIDPLDGTTNFRMGNPLFGISIAWAHGGQLQLGITYAPVLNLFWEAELGQGATLNSKKIQVSHVDRIKNSINLYCHGYRKKDLEQAIKIYNKLKLAGRDIRQLGSSVWEFGLVALGRAESIFLPGARLWDVAAGALIIREAGGKVTDFEGKEWNIDSPDILASNGKIQNQLLKIIQPIANQSNSQYSLENNHFKNAELIYPALSYKIVGLLFDVHNQLGAGLREKSYQLAMAKAFEVNNIPFRQQLKNELKYKDEKIKNLFMDFLVDNKIILEIKAQDRFDKNNISQVYDYLKTSGLKLAILANFTSNGVKFKRLVNKFANK